MPFPEKIRAWAKRISDNQCQTMVYSEKRGFQKCGKKTDLHVDHLDPENFVHTNGGDPNNDSTPMVRCKDHHIGPGIVQDEGETRIAQWGEKNWSRHADVGLARLRYRQGDKEAIGRALKRHHERAERGEKYWNSDDGVDQYEREQAEELIWKAHLRGDNRPRVRPMRDIPKRKKWYDTF